MSMKHKVRHRRPFLRIAVLCVTVVLILVLFVVPMAYISNIMHNTFTRFEYTDPRFTCDYRYEHFAADYPREEVSFDSDGNTLKGWIYGGENDKGLIVFAHGLGTGHESYICILLELVDRGWRVFAYDATGCCESEGDGTQGLVRSALDLDNALSYVENDKELSSLPLFVMGHSWGGYAAAAVLGFDHDVDGCVTLSGYDKPMRELTETAEDMLGADTAKLAKPYIWLYNKLTFGKYSSLSAVESINSTDTPVLVVHGSNDKRVKYRGASIINKKKSITNPHVKYKVMSEKGRKGHNTYWHSKNGINYINKVMKPQYQQLSDEYNGNIPDDTLENFYSSLDAELVNDINLELIDSIDEFLYAQL